MVIGVIQVGLMFLRWCSFLWVLMFSFMISSIVHRIVVVVGGVFFGIWWVGVCLVFWLIWLIMFFSVGYMVFHIFVWGWLSVGVPSIWALHPCIGVVCILCSPCVGVGGVLFVSCDGMVVLLLCLIRVSWSFRPCT